jgi:AcrR family transcriptional regulator
MQSTQRVSDRPRGRRTQQERREATRQLLLEATVESLVELGYSGTTTLEIERRARVSRGARIHHYPTKAALLADAVDHLYDQVAEHYEAAFGRASVDPALPPEQQAAARLRSGLRLIWSVHRRPAFAAVLELNMAARTDEELRARLHEVSDRQRQGAIAAASQYFGLEPDLGRKLVEAIHAAMIGLLMQSNVEQDEQREDATLSLIEAMVVPHLPISPRQ